MTASVPRVAVYGLGRYGCASVRLVHQKGWSIVAVYNRSGEKVGKDVGRLAGLDLDLGVPVQDCDTADYEALRTGADIAIVATSDRLVHNIEGYERLLAAGVNVLSHGTESYYPAAVNPALADRIQTLAENNGVTFTGTGIWDMSRIWSGILAAAPCVELTSLHHTSRTNLGRSTAAAVVGIGLSSQEYEETIVQQPGPIGELYKIIPWQVMTALGYEVIDVVERREPVLFDHPVHASALERDIAPGDPAGTRILVAVTTAEGVSAHAKIELRVCEEHEPKDFMRWSVEGDPNSTVHVDRQVGLPGSAASMINRVHDVIAAPPGIQEVYRLGPPGHSALQGPR